MISHVSSSACITFTVKTTKQSMAQHGSFMRFLQCINITRIMFCLRAVALWVLQKATCFTQSRQQEIVLSVYTHHTVQAVGISLAARCQVTENYLARKYLQTIKKINAKSTFS